jgi:hypothetical protein
MQLEQRVSGEATTGDLDGRERRRSHAHTDHAQVAEWMPAAPPAWMTWEADGSGTHRCERYRIHAIEFAGRATHVLQGYGLDLMSSNVDYPKAAAQHYHRRMRRKMWRRKPQSDVEPPLWMGGGGF